MAPRRRAVEEADSDEDASLDEEDQPSAKRARADPDDHEFKRGTVKLIRVHDFMTYVGTVTITPGPRLNLLLGPNGTGKSSLVCALCVGLAGSTKLLGRADNLYDYVRRNCSSCWTEITLSSGSSRQPDIVIRRSISVEHYMDTDGQRKRKYVSDFKINNHPATQEAVKAKVKELNIQFDNLCQFLPQDKVVEFAKMNPQELLVATEKALGDSTLHDTHMQLIRMRTQAKEQEGELQVMQGQLQRLEAEQQRQQRDYERYEQRERLRKRVKLLRHKALWLKVEDAQQARKATATELKQAQKALAEREKEVRDDQAPVKTQEQAKGQAVKASEQAKGAVTRADHAVRMAGEDIDKVKEELDDMLQKQAGLQEASEKRHSTISNLQREVAELQAKVRGLPTGLPQEMQTRHAELQAQHREAVAQLNTLGEDGREKQAAQQQLDRDISELQRQDQHLSNTRMQRLIALAQQNNYMGQKGRAMQQVYEWLNANRHQFRGPVYGPVFMEVDVHKPRADVPGSERWAAYLEKQCGGNMYNFVTSLREDEKLLSDFVKSRRDLESNITVTMVNHAFNDRIPHTAGNAAEYSDFGITHTLDEVFDAPQLVKHMLHDICRIGTAFVGSQRTKEMSEQLFSTHKTVTNVYAADVRMSYTVSRYNAASSTTMVDGVGDARLLSGESQQVVEQQRAQVAAQLRQKQEERGALQRELQEVEQERGQLQQLMANCARGVKEIQDRQKAINDQRAKANSDLSMKQRRLATEEAKPDPMEQAPALRAQSQQLLGVLARKGGKLVELTHKYWTAMRAYMAAELRVKEAETQLEALKQRQLQQRGELTRATKARDEAERKANAAKQVFMEAKAAAEEEGPMTEELKAEFEPLPGDPQELEQEEARVQAEADAIVLNDESAVREYEQRKVRIENTRRQVADKVSSQEEAEAALAAKQASWLPVLKELVGRINDKFGVNFKEIGCAGEVDLYEDEDYEKCAIHIRVKFREEEQLQLLTATRQSGGERSVSTILYLIALQGITQTPFRVVDEINQGMDPVNERKVFIQLVESSCKPDTPQCFLLTPKLLPALPFEPQITVLIIQNGAGAKDMVRHYARVDNNAHTLLGSRLHAAPAT